MSGPGRPGAPIHRRVSSAAMWGLLALVPLAFLALELHRSPVGGDNGWNPGDDWAIYRRRAMSVVRDGWTMPGVPRAYARPSGFLYVYFLAGVFRMAGDRPAVAYAVQSTLLGLTACLLVAGFRRVLSPGASLAYLAGLVGFLYVDVFRHYTNRLLSENLLIVLLPAALLLCVRAAERASVGLAGAAGAALGVAILTRPNVILTGLALGALLPVRARSRGRAAALLAAAGGGLLGMLALMAARNYAVTGRATLAVFTHTRDWAWPATSPDAGPAGVALALVSTFGARVLYCLGFLPVLASEYRVRPHWILMWAGVLLFLLQLRRRRPALWEVAVLVCVLTYLAPLVVVSELTNYGFRVLVPIVPITLVLAVRALDVRWSATASATRPP